LYPYIVEVKTVDAAADAGAVAVAGALLGVGDGDPTPRGEPMRYRPPKITATVTPIATERLANLVMGMNLHRAAVRRLCTVVGSAVRIARRVVDGRVVGPSSNHAART
jgi:hypothetical protein